MFKRWIVFLEVLGGWGRVKFMVIKVVIIWGVNVMEKMEVSFMFGFCIFFWGIYKFVSSGWEVEKLSRKYKLKFWEVK